MAYTPPNPAYVADIRDYLSHYRPRHYDISERSLLIPRLVALMRSRGVMPGGRDLGERFSLAYRQLDDVEKKELFGPGLAAAEKYSKSLPELLQTTFAHYRKQRAGLEKLVHKRLQDAISEVAGMPVTRLLSTPVAQLDAFRLMAIRDVVGRYSTRPLPYGELVGIRPDQPPSGEYTFRLSRVLCEDQEDLFGDDEIFFASVAVDGSGTVTAQTSQTWSMDVGQLRDVFWTVYPMANPKQFLDISVQMYESDRVLATMAKTMTWIADVAKGVAGGFAAGILLAAGEIVEFLGDLDPDDDLGLHNFTFSGDTALRQGTTAEARSYSGSGVHYEVGFQLLEKGRPVEPQDHLGPVVGSKGDTGASSHWYEKTGNLLMVGGGAALLAAGVGSYVSSRTVAGLAAKKVTRGTRIELAKRARNARRFALISGLAGAGLVAFGLLRD